MSTVIYTDGCVLFRREQRRGEFSSGKVPEERLSEGHYLADETHDTDRFEDEFKREVFDYLDALRDSGVTNVFGAVTYLREKFNLDGGDARGLLVEWMMAFGRGVE